MPLAGMRYSMPDVGSGMYFEPLLRYDASFAGDPSRKSINNLQFAPEVNFMNPLISKGLENGVFSPSDRGYEREFAWP